MTPIINELGADNVSNWDNFAKHLDNSCLYHLSKWREIIKTSYGHQSYYLIAKFDGIDSRNFELNAKELGAAPTNGVDHCDKGAVGILPLVHMKHWLFGNGLVSIPYVDSAGILAQNELAERALLDKSVGLAEELGAHFIELRHNRPISSFVDGEQGSVYASSSDAKRLLRPKWEMTTREDKVRIVLCLPDSPEQLLKSFNPKLRSQIRKPMKEGLFAKVGGVELVDDFYDVFATNMRDLGSPVHAKSFIVNVLSAFSATSRLFVVYRGCTPMACALGVGFKNSLANPWASSLRKYSQLAPNMLLFWTMLEYACQSGYQCFDFGRSSPGSGTYRFKEQWGARPEPLYWYRLSRLAASRGGKQRTQENLTRAIEYWKKLPVPLTKMLGPRIRKYISL